MSKLIIFHFFINFAVSISTVSVFGHEVSSVCDSEFAMETSSEVVRLNEAFEKISSKKDKIELSVMDQFVSGMESAKIPKDAGENYVLIDFKNNLRLDLIAKDFIDQVELILSEKGFEHLNEDLKITLGDNPLANFKKWYIELIELTESNKKLKRRLNNNLVFQIYDSAGVAIAHSVHVSSPNFRQRIKRNQDILKYNTIALDPEAQGLLISLQKERTPFSTKTITVAKIDSIKKKEIKGNELTYYEQFCSDLLSMPDMKTEMYEVECDPKKKQKVKLSVKKGASKDIKETLKPLFEATYNSHQKRSYFKTLSDVNNDQFNAMPSPKKMVENIGEFNETIKEQTYMELLSGENDETVLQLRKWVKKNLSEINKRLKKYNDENDPDIEFSIKNPKRIRRYEVFEQYSELTKLFPDTPWVESQEFTIITPEGRKVITGKSYLEKLVYYSKEYAKGYLNPETIISYGVGTGAAFLTGGNVMAGALTKTIVKDAISGFRYDRSIKDTFEHTPFKIISSVAGSAGFVPGEIPLGAFAGSVTGGIRSALTGQDIQKGMIVGAGFGAMRTALPYDVAYPSVKMEVGEKLTKTYAAKSIALDASTNALYHGSQGALVSLWQKDETLSEGLAKGALYGGAESLIFSSLFGVRYDMFGRIDEEKLNKQFSEEANYHPKVNTFGIREGNPKKLYEEFWDASDGVPYRVAYGNWGWYTEKVMGGEASFSTPWFITSPVAHFGSAGTIAHEVSHQVQYRNLGGANFLLGYSLEALKDGTNGSHMNSENAELISNQGYNKYEQYQGHKD